ncbi:MAG: glutamate synthase large subunit [Myxococcales bacterium]|nr:glutamate synthase large subunit [Myxococcales bacterium]
MGFVAHLRGEASHGILQQALQLLRRLSHRAAVGADPHTGDGAGVLLQLSRAYLGRIATQLGLDAARPHRYALGQLMLPADPTQRGACEALVERAVHEEGQQLLGWRDVPVDVSAAGPFARSVMPVFRQVLVGRRGVPPSAFERVLFVIRKRFEAAIRTSGVDPEERFHCASLSGRTVVFKGLLLPRQLDAFFTDLRSEQMVTAIAMVHSRFSTNTFPRWDLAQPFHRMCHNGEINTLRGNRNWMAARRTLLQSAKFPGGLQRLQPLIVPGRSDSAQFDNMLELLHLGGRDLPQALMMMIPEAIHDEMPADRASFYRYAESVMEPWDGPAAIAFTDGSVVGATLDRNGLRPARYLVTDDDRVVLSSETGVLDVPAGSVRSRGRLRPGRMLLVDTVAGRILKDDELKAEVVARHPYGRWVQCNTIRLEDAAGAPTEPPESGCLDRLQRAFGYTDEDVPLILEPMARTGSEPVGSMGNDTPLAVLSRRAPPLSRYFHQLFAQVTNPPIDPIREAVVMSLRTTIGPGGNPLDETPEPAPRVVVDGPVLTTEQLRQLMEVSVESLEPVCLDTTWPVGRGPAGMAEALESLCESAADQVDCGAAILVLTDRAVSEERVAIPALLAASAVHQHLIRAGSRLQAGLVVQTAEAREVHDVACLLGFGVAAVHPWLALDTVRSLGDSASEQAYVGALHKGLRKILSKMGISTLAGYRGAQIFEAVGLDRTLVARHFTGTASRLGGIGLQRLAVEALERHRRGFVGGEQQASPGVLPTGGDYRWRRRGEAHAWGPAAIAALQAATGTGSGSAEAFARFCALVDDEDNAACALRSLLDFDLGSAVPVPVHEVESVEAICTRFVTGAMSFGSISPEAHETLAIAMNRIGGRSNSGEGGEEPDRFQPDASGADRCSRIKQVASGRFGVTAHYLVHADDLQIKIAQGAKPGEGGQLPGHKVDARIAAVRHATPGVTLISPPPHHDIYSIEDLAQLIYDLQCVNPTARVSVKLVSELGVGTVAAGVAKARAGAVVIAGASGGTGASPLSSIKRAGLPWELGLAETQQVLVRNGLRDRIRVQVDGGLRTPRDLAIATLLGAEEWGVATAALVVQGCVMLRKCHRNTCSVGIATQDPRLRSRYRGSPEAVVAYFRMLAEGLRSILARLGFRSVQEMVGQVERLRIREVDHDKARSLDLAPLLARPEEPRAVRHFVSSTPWDFRDHIDVRLVDACGPALDADRRVRLTMPVANTDRAVGAGLSGEIARRRGARGLPEGTVTVQLSGSAGQSFGAFLAPGVSLQLAGDANDYVGKGLSGGVITIRPSPGTRYAPEEHVILGNVALYGATAGALFASGRAGERFAVRNSGAKAVVEGVGDHGCEYMTGGVVLVLGPTGRNFAAGMSGGVAYVVDRDGSFVSRCSGDGVELGPVQREAEATALRGLLHQHVELTSSPLGGRLLRGWEDTRRALVRVMPLQYQRAIGDVAVPWA